MSIWIVTRQIDEGTPVSNAGRIIRTALILGAVCLVGAIGAFSAFSSQTESILSGWQGSAANVVVRITTGIALIGGLLGQNEGLQVFDATNTTALPLGAIDLKQQYVAKTALLLSGTMTFGASPGTPSTMSISGGVVTIVLGTHAGNNALTVTTPGTMAWGPATTPYDRAANPSSGATANESGVADVEF